MGIPTPEDRIWTYRGTVPGHDDNGHVIIFTPMKKLCEAWIELAFYGNRFRFDFDFEFADSWIRGFVIWNRV